MAGQPTKSNKFLFSCTTNLRSNRKLIYYMNILLSRFYSQLGWIKIWFSIKENRATSLSQSRFYFHSLLPAFSDGSIKKKSLYSTIAKKNYLLSLHQEKLALGLDHLSNQCSTIWPLDQMLKNGDRTVNTGEKKNK